ncbi:30S ribosomal protein S16 [Pseudomonadota bacterium]
MESLDFEFYSATLDWLFQKGILFVNKPFNLLKIRLSRTGKKDQESFRIIVQEHARSVKRKFLEVVGHYRATIEPRTFEAKKDRIEYWISQGAKPTDTLASLLKRNGYEDMDQYIVEPRDKQRKKKKEEEEKPAAPAAAAPAELSKCRCQNSATHDFRTRERKR